MKKKLALLAAPIAMLAASTTMAVNLGGVTPYVGADVEWRHMNFERGFGNNLFNDNYPQGNLYVGAQFNEYVAVEAGYQATERKTRTSILTTGAVLAGVNIPAATTVQSNSTGQITGLHANLLGFLPICDAYRLKLIGLVGFTRLKANFVSTVALVNGVPQLNLANTSETFTARKSVLRLGAGLQHMINCNWGVRAMLKWEQSNKLKMQSVNANHPVLGANTATLKAKNSFIYSIGAFYQFN